MVASALGRLLARQWPLLPHAAFVAASTWMFRCGLLPGTAYLTPDVLGDQVQVLGGTH
jgi:hypothetical protein